MYIVFTVTLYRVFQKEEVSSAGQGWETGRSFPSFPAPLSRNQGCQRGIR